MARPKIHTLLLEQEAAIDALFLGAYQRMMARIARVQEQPPPVARVRTIIREELESIHGRSAADAINSPIGKLIVTYANAARKYVFQRVIADMQIVIGRTGTLESVQADLANGEVLKAANDALNTVLARLDVSGRLPVGLDPTMANLENADDNTRAIVLAVLDGSPNGNQAALASLRQETISNRALAVAFAAGSTIPRSVDDTASWKGSDGRRLADRIYSSLVTLTRIISQRFLTRYTYSLQTNWLNDDLGRYLVAGYSPARTAAGVIVPSEAVGGFTSAGSGLGSFSVRRLGRGETTRAYGDVIREIPRRSEITPAIRWVLNPAHPGADECDDLSEGSSPGLPPGCYTYGDVPFYPNHFNCLCSLELVDLEGRRPADLRRA